ncbi:MAG TPA: glycosyltransferase family 2 protein [Tepidisphaeraceae bacterium]|nr:glycosyltransferase family 2 protein [Tepidisphaeraceae bacterium]
MKPDFSIITPSFNSLEFLQRACASVRDQTDVNHEHIVVDACSSDGTPEWLRENVQQSIIERDDGMYDAINKGMEIARGDYFAYLNCDEQYLPGTLARVKECFEENPDVDIIYGDCLIIRCNGELLSYRRAYPLRYAYVAAWQLYIMTASIFYRRNVIDQGFRFDKRFRISGDWEFLLQLLQNGHRCKRIKAPLACFAITGKNLSGNKPQRERELELQRTPAWAKWLRHPINAARLVEKALAGAYRRAPIRYECYTGTDLSWRSVQEVARPEHRWPAWDAT